MRKQDKELVAAQMEVVNQTIGPWKFQVLFTLFNTGVFDFLETGPADCPVAAEKLGIPLHSLERIMQCGVALGFLEQSEDIYRNSYLTKETLVRGKPGYLGNWLTLAAKWYESFGKLEQGIRADQPVENVNFDSDPQYQEIFIRGMIDYACSRGRDILSHLDLSGRKRLLDVGCGPAAYSVMFCEQYPSLACTCLDLPHALEIAKEYVGQKDMTGRINFTPSDYRKSKSLGHGYDVIFLSHILHQEDKKICLDLLGKCIMALEPDGLLVIQAMFPKPGGVQSVFGALHDILSFLIFPGGSNHSANDVCTWLMQAGFVEVRYQSMSLLNVNSLVLGRKPNA